MSKQLRPEEVAQVKEWMASLLDSIGETFRELHSALLNLFDGLVCPACQRRAHEHSEKDWQNCVARLSTENSTSA
jgi:hypothetical protein